MSNNYINVYKNWIISLADDFDNRTVTVTASPGETMVAVLIPIFDDDLSEVFDVVIEIGGTDTDGAIVGQPGVAQVTIVSEDG